MKRYNAALLLIIAFIMIFVSSCASSSRNLTVPSSTVSVSVTSIDSFDTATQTVANTPAVEETQPISCLPSLSSDVSLEGGILFYEYVGAESPDKTRVWLWSKDMPTPQVILEIPANVEVLLSPSGEKLVWHDYGTDHFTVYDLISKEQKDFKWNPSWRYVSGWKDNETVSILVNHDDIFEVGTKEETVDFNVSKASFTSQDTSLNLPGYPLDSSVKDAPMDGFAIMDPSGSVIIYTAYIDDKPKVILIKRYTGEILWENKAQYPFYPPPDWTLDGERVAFVTYEKGPVIFTLSRDGKKGEIIAEGAPQRIVRDIKWSPDQKYIYYSYWNTIEEGPTSIVNVDTKQQTEICTPGHTFLRGTWLPNNNFAYIVREGEQTDQDGLAELRILNTKDWSYQTFFRTNTKVGPTVGFWHRLDILGWTPLLNQ
jgi:hypothetical protein